MKAYEGLMPLYGDIHNHCAISYGHGSLEDAYRNAREQLDFFSVTGHAFWPDMPAPNDRNRQLIAFHEAGFERLRGQWDRVREVTRAICEEEGAIAFLGFEMHSCRDGDYTVLYRDLGGDILYSAGLSELRDKLRAVRQQGHPVLAIPQHMGYRRGHRGVNWHSFTDEFSPLVEIVSMHGCSETDEVPRPFLHTMGPSDHEGTVQFGLEMGHVFGVIGSTDHHSAHPGSYGHGLGGVWAPARSREAVWDALEARRSWAMTGDRIALRAAIDDQPMGSVIPVSRNRRIDIEVEAGGAIDYVDVVRDNRLLRRFSQCDLPGGPAGERVRTTIFLEVGWGPRNTRISWDVRLGISAGRIELVEPRFRGREVVSPSDRDEDGTESHYLSQCSRVDEHTVQVSTVTFGNPNNSTQATQGVCLHVDMPRTATVQGDVNGKEFAVPLTRLLDGAIAEPMDEMPAPSFRLHRAPLPDELRWSVGFEDRSDAAAATYYVRVRQRNDQWAWSSPIFVRS